MKKEISAARRNFGFRLVVLARHWRQAIDARVHAAGLSDATWRPLIYLHRMGDGVRQKELARSLGMDSSSVVRLLDILAARGLVERREDPADGRAKTLHLTESGHRVVTDVQHLLSNFEDGLLAGLEDAEVGSLLQSFDRIESALDATRTDHW